MRTFTGAWARLGALAGLGAVALAGLAAPALAQQPYGGLWAGTAAQCRDPDGVDRMEITGNRFFWYETRCTAHGIATAGPGSWTMRLTCEGEGQRFTARPRISLPTPDRLVMENGPVGPNPRRQSYIRCPGL
jgi:hypothetical protein